MIMGVFSGITFFIKLSIRIFLRKFHHHTSRRSDDFPSQKYVLPIFQFSTEKKSYVKLAVDRLQRDGQRTLLRLQI
jgi:hypothetical protein